MNSMLRGFVVTLVASWSAVALAQDTGKAPSASRPAGTQPTEAKIEPEAQKLLDAAKEAMRKARTLSFKVQQSAGSGDNEQKSGAVLTIDLVAKSRDDQPFGRYKAVLLDDHGKPTAEWAIDGQRIFKLDHAETKLLAMDLPADEPLSLPMELRAVFPEWLFADRVDNPMLKTVALTVGPEERVAGVKCRVLTQVCTINLPQQDAGDEAADAPARPKIKLTIVRWLGADDLIPRRFKTMFRGEAENRAVQEWTVLCEMSAMKVNPELKPADYALEAPEGYASEAGTTDNMGLTDESARQAAKLKAAVGKPALGFQLKDAQDKLVTLDSLKGRVILLDFWATWCGPCKAAMPAVQKLHERFAGKPVTIIGVNCWEQKAEAAIKYMEQQKYTYKLLLKGDELAKQYGVTGIPTMILIGKDGTVLHTLVGFGEDEGEHLGKMIQKELDRK